jgi:hypothetical protein
MTSNEHFQKAQKKADKYGITIYRSASKGHKYMFRNPDNGKLVHFGSLGYEDYLSHNDINRRNNYRKRHAGILLRDGTPAYKKKYTPAWASYYILW